jgi:hypothetical protein
MTLWVSISNIGDYQMIEDELANLSIEIASNDGLPDTPNDNAAAEIANP